MSWLIIPHVLKNIIEIWRKELAVLLPVSTLIFIINNNEMSNH